ncbi:hypothetical protein AVEN_111294-1 [Araneus ventricosus]|uniref:Methyltransferase type 11 domain-containing protein n=1 Tax=Araneus ventricosus TaxID=182803 RepID=A0A4Y2RCI1_ARAVE|nr:hypothetical protein AVEN_111294-1 [Araneus ventricosus]
MEAYDPRYVINGSLPPHPQTYLSSSIFYDQEIQMESWISEAVIHPQGGASSAEKLPFEEGSVQLLSAATALHWFDLDTFLPEARRVLCVNGVMAVYGYLNMKPLLNDPTKAAEVDELFIKYNKVLEPHHVVSRVSLLHNRYKDVEFPFEEVNRYPDVRCTFEGKLPDIVNYVSTWSGYQNFKKVDSKGAEELLDFFRKRLYEIASACNISPEDSTTLYRDFQLILCRKTQDGPFV